MFTSDCAFSIIVKGLIIGIFLTGVSARYNYPEGPDSGEPCMKLRNTVQLVAPICVPKNDAGEFTEESIANCGKLKESCPEFNKWECMWYGHPCKGAPLGVLQVPTCRLKYYARHYTWGEIYYTNQFGTKLDFSIVELHRFIQKHGAFPHDQPDFPQNVQDPGGDRGLRWTETDATWKVRVYIEKNLTTEIDELKEVYSKSYHMPIPGIRMCDKSDESYNCKGLTLDYVNYRFPYGIPPISRPPLTDAEIKAGGVAKYDVSALCDYIFIDGQALPACRLIFNRHAFEKTQPWLEMHFWQKSNYDEKTQKVDFGLRYSAIPL